jgi:phosphoenolpyruvate-protein phosphotransferase
MLELFFTCPLPHGLHARPASALEEVSRRFAAQLTLANLRTGQACNAKSVLALVALDLRFDDRCRLTARGEDEREATTALASFIDVELPRCDAPLPPLAAQDEVRLPPVLRAAGPTAHRATPVAPGIGRGTLVRVGGLVVPDELARGVASDVDEEIRRMDEAFGRLLSDYDATLQEMGQGVQAEILSAHRSVARDPELKHWLDADIRARRASAASAIVAAETHFSKMLAATGSAILRDRALDVRDVCVQLLVRLHGPEIGSGDIRLDADSVCAADTLTPGQLLSLDRRLLKGVVLGHGSATSHTAILARSFGIPMLAGVSDLDDLGLDRHDVIVDYDMEQARLGGRLLRQQAVVAQPAATEDGFRIEVGANIASAAEASAACSAGAEGIGLFRTELLFADRPQAPGAAVQAEQYRAVLAEAGDRPVLIRTLDVGGDKPLPYLRLPAENNPFLGRRGVRLYGSHETLIRDQVRALVRASAHGRLGLMIPMVSRLEEVQAVKALVSEEQDRCAAEGIPFDARMRVGAMIEVPSAAFALAELARELDFFSVGTNDLLQYFVAADRTNPRVGDLYNASTPAFIRLLKKIVDDVHAAGRWVGVCGEMAGDGSALPLLVGLGFDEISGALPRVGAIKAAVRRLSAAACRELVAHALASTTAREVEILVRDADCWRPAPLIEPHLIVLDADCRTREEAIKTAVDRLYVMDRTDAPRDIEEAVWTREAVYSTGFGHGFAIPHCKTKDLRSNSMVVLRLRQPVEWDALDGQPVGVVVLLAVRDAEHARAHMKVLATLARQLMHEEFRDHLRQESDAEALCTYLLDRIGD